MCMFPFLVVPLKKDYVRFHKCVTNAEKYLKYCHATVDYLVNESVCTLFLLVNGSITCPVAKARLGNILNTSHLSHPN